MGLTGGDCNGDSGGCLEYFPEEKGLKNSYASSANKLNTASEMTAAVLFILTASSMAGGFNVAGIRKLLIISSISVGIVRHRVPIIYAQLEPGIDNDRSNPQHMLLY
ncbi:hypothetical protein M0804_009208 [Polistes exclamans]|nr:hypothetical protein M0804_009208 [Polistes exclamans]